MAHIKSVTGAEIEIEFYQAYTWDDSQIFRFKVEKRWKNFDTGKLTYSEDFQQDLVRHGKDFTINFPALITFLRTLVTGSKHIEYVERLKKYSVRINEIAALKRSYADKKKNAADQIIIIRNLKEYGVIFDTVMKSTEYVVEYYTEAWKEIAIKWLETWKEEIEGKNLEVVLEQKYKGYNSYKIRNQMKAQLSSWFIPAEKKAVMSYEESRKMPYHLKKNYKQLAEDQARRDARSMVEHYAGNIAFKTATFMKGKTFTLELKDVQTGAKGLSAWTTFTSSKLSFSVKSQSVFASGMIKCEHYRYLMTFHEVMLNKKLIGKRLTEKEMIETIK